MKHTQNQLVVLALAEHGEWRRPYELERQFVGTEMVGSESDTRLGEWFPNGLLSEDSTVVKIDLAEYTLETKKIGAARWYRAFLSKEAPAKPVFYVRHPRTGERITTEQLAAL